MVSDHYNNYESNGNKRFKVINNLVDYSVLVLIWIASMLMILAILIALNKLGII